jgi:carbohydrate-selective porin OprB
MTVIQNNSPIFSKTAVNLTVPLEALYRYRVNNNIDITPGFITILNPEGNRNNSTVFVGIVRTSFQF